MYINLVHTMQLALLMHEERAREALGLREIRPGGPVDVYGTSRDRRTKSNRSREARSWALRPHRNEG
ncbi:MAG: hypothetical protein BAA04_01195 [Firmicutes bacterium ZCTH02-B6]|nr:MAG: hypothetical protein BAA04_01195 [Firmicutes bacterium ZCTH02-B6]